MNSTAGTYQIPEYCKIYEACMDTGLVQVRCEKKETVFLFFEADREGTDFGQSS